MKRRNFVKGIGALMVIGAVPIALPAIGESFRMRPGDVVYCKVGSMDGNQIWLTALVLKAPNQNSLFDIVKLGSTIPEFDRWNFWFVPMSKVRFRVRGDARCLRIVDQYKIRGGKLDEADRGYPEESYQMVLLDLAKEDPLVFKSLGRFNAGGS